VRSKYICIATFYDPLRPWLLDAQEEVATDSTIFHIIKIEDEEFELFKELGMEVVVQ